jgi:hypothetical protein
MENNEILFRDNVNEFLKRYADCSSLMQPVVFEQRYV